MINWDAVLNKALVGAVVGAIFVLISYLFRKK